MKNNQFIICAVIVLVLCICNFTIPNVSIPCVIGQFIAILWMMVLGIKEDLKKESKK
jgi:hypothetical protein